MKRPDKTSNASDLANAPQLLNRKVRTAQAMIMFERMWRALLWPFCLVAGFTLVTLGDIWSLLGSLAHWAGLAGFATAFLASLIPLARVTWPGRDEGLRRLEQVSGIGHRPATSYDDQLAGAASEQQRALWDEHKRRIAGLITRLSAGWPHPRLAKADPYALRAALLLMLCVAFISSGETSWQRLVSAFNVTPSGAVSRFRIDAWVTPPLYTAKPPIVLAEGDGVQHIRQLTTPEKSLLLVRVNGPASLRPDVQIESEGNSLDKKVEPASSEDGFAEYKIIIDRKMTVHVGSIGFARATWHFDVIRDSAPAIEVTREPSRAPRGALRFAFRVKDDYGVASAEARFALAGKPAPETSTKSGKISEQLSQDMDSARLQAFKPPHIALALPRANARIGEARAYKDLTSHPWAGLKVAMTLYARDQAGQEGASRPFEFVLPARKFTKPLAKALIEQRKTLVRAPDERPSVQRALRALTIAPELFMKDTTLYLALRSAHWRLHYDEGPEGLKSVVDQLWDLALRIEDGDLPQAEAALKAAQDALRKALEEGASEAEISKLVAELRAALNKFLQAMAEKALQNGDLAQMPEGLGQQRTLSSKDIEEMLRNIESLAKTGSREMAQQLLDKLSGMMQRLQMGQENPNSQSKQMMEMVRGLGELIQRQQKLLDETFKERRKLNDPKREQSPGERLLSERNRAERKLQRERQGMQGLLGPQGPMGRGRSGEGEGQQQGRGQGKAQGQAQGQNQGEGQAKGQGSGQRRYGGLINRQGSIRDRLDGLLEQLRNLGTRPPDEFEDAGRAMGEAEKALGKRNLGRATQQQTLALDRLRQGTQSVAERVLQALSSRVGQGGRGNKDPFGRPERTQGPDLGTSVRVPDQIDIQRAREILDELRKRLGEPSRPMLELDYLERLIKKF